MSDHELRRLEAASLHIIREAAAEARNPVLLYSIGKDSSVLLHLVLKAFRPAPPPFPLLHIDTGWKFREMIAHRDATAARFNLRLIVHTNQAGAGIDPFTNPGRHTQVMKTEALRQALDTHSFDVAIGGARRDEERSRAKERVFSPRGPNHTWDPRHQRPEFWDLYNATPPRNGTLRVFPLSDWTEADVWDYAAREAIPLVPLYFAAPRPVIERNGALILAHDPRLPLQPGETPRLQHVRFRSLGCWPLTAAIPSMATTLAGIRAELAATTRSERAGRLIDRDQPASMERKKREGYF